MILLAKKALILVGCIPMYPLIMFAVYYEKSTSFGGKFRLGEATKEYWSDVWEAITYRKEARR